MIETRGDFKLHDIMLQIQITLSKKDNQIEGLNLQLQKLEEIKKSLQKKKILKYCITVLTFFLCVYFSQSTIIHWVSYFQSSDHTVLQDRIDTLIPSDMKVDDALTQDILLPTWNVEERKPTLFSRLMNERHQQTEYQLPLREMVFASASDPVYFDAANLSYKNSLGEDVHRQFIGGSCIAENPAMYSYLFASDFAKVPPSKITVTTVGAQQFQQTKIENNVSPF